MRKELLCYILLTVFRFTVYAQDNTTPGKGLYTSDFVIDGIPRYITFYIPAKYGSKSTYPLVLFLHGMNESAKNAIKVYGDIIHAKADSTDCIVVYPDAVAGHWNDYINDSMPAPGSVNDAGFISIMIDYFVQQYHCDPNRVYATGFEAGGKMTYRLSCNIPKKITAIAAFISSPDETAKKCAAGESVAIMDTNKFSAQTGRRPDVIAINEAWNFFMEHVKK